MARGEPAADAAARRGWLTRTRRQTEDSQGAGWGDGDESVGHQSGRKIVDILQRNPKKDPSKYTGACRAQRALQQRLTLRRSRRRSGPHAQGRLVLQAPPGP